MAINKNIGVGPIVVGILIIVLAAAAYVLLPNLFRPTVNLQLGDGLFRATVAETQVDRTIVFSGSTNSNRALLKVFPYENKWKITIKDINNTIDIVWLDKDKKVVFIMKNASSDTIPVDDFEPMVASRYVVELPPGTVDSKLIKIGGQAVFEIDESKVQ